MIAVASRVSFFSSLFFPQLLGFFRASSPMPFGGRGEGGNESLCGVYLPTGLNPQWFYKKQNNTHTY